MREFRKLDRQRGREVTYGAGGLSPLLYSGSGAEAMVFWWELKAVVIRLDGKHLSAERLSLEVAARMKFGAVHASHLDQSVILECTLITFSLAVRWNPKNRSNLAVLSLGVPYDPIPPSYRETCKLVLPTSKANGATTRQIKTRKAGSRECYLIKLAGTHRTSTET